MFIATRGFLKRFYHQWWVRLFPNYQIELEKSVGNCKSLLDVGCGSCSPIKAFSEKMYCVGVDIFSPSIEKSKKMKIHNTYFQMNILEIGEKIEPNSFDCVLASDVIEHLTKEDGLRLIEMMEKIAKRKVIIFTPNGFLPQGEYDNNIWQVHKSGWTVQEMEKRGYKVVGINGWKPLRGGECGDVRFWPKYFWLMVSDITQFFVRNKPNRAFQILCVKTTEPSLL